MLLLAGTALAVGTARYGWSPLRSTVAAEIPAGVGVLRLLGVLGYLGVVLLVVAGCGNDLPPGAVAKVGDSEITQAEFDKWLKTAVSGQAQGGTVAVPDPPDFTKCVSAKKKAPAPEGQDKPSDSQLKKRCKQEYDQLKREVMQFLIQAEWVQQEADQQGIEVSQKAVQKSLEDQKKQAFPSEKAYQEFLKTSGMSQEDILFRVELDQLQQKLTQKVTEDAKNVSNADIQEYYEKNQQRFAQPERRDLRVVLTKTEAQANQAKKALDDGDSLRRLVEKTFPAVVVDRTVLAVRADEVRHAAAPLLQIHKKRPVKHESPIAAGQVATEGADVV